MQFTAYTEEHEPLVKAFNTRLRDGGYAWRYAESHVGRYPRREGVPLYEESFLALDRGQVRGGYHLKHQQFAIQGVVDMAAFLQFPVSEGLVDPAYKMVGVLLLRDAVRRQPLILSVGGGGMNEPLPRLEKASNWTVYAIAFFFKVIHASPFFANIAYLRDRGSRRIALDLLRYTGLGWAGLGIAQFRPNQPRDRLQISLEPEFDASWADELWARCKDQYSFIAVRDAVTLNTIYPHHDPHYLRLRILRDGRTIAWAILLDSELKNHKQFGNMRVGAIVDCLAAPRDATAVVSAATDYLQVRGVDIIFSNQTSLAWCDALRRSGFLAGPSNFALGLSPQLAGKLQPNKRTIGSFHLNRGDGDRPTHLFPTVVS